MNATPEMTAAGTAPANAPARNNIVMDCQIDKVFYGDFLAVRASKVPIEKNKITGFIGPSGCGKSTVLRSLNRMNDLIPIFRFEGKVTYHGQDIYDRKVDPVVVRRYIGMVFQQPNPFAMSIYDNVAFGLRLNGFKGDMDERVEKALKGAACWNEVKDKLKNSGLSLSGGQQQRLCIARTIAVNPDVILMDEPCSALDPIATARIEDLIDELRESYAICIVTHSMQQAARVSQRTAYFHLGDLVEVGDTNRVFTNPRAKLTEDYITGRFG